MTWEEFEGQWQNVKETLTSRWARLTEDDIENLAGDKSGLVGKLRERYGVSQDEAENQAEAWVATRSSCPPTSSEVDLARAEGEGMGLSHDAHAA
jgi:uncharacterized protein YjbJ (UPF0337 family)